MMTEQPIEPILKWAGGKRQIIEEILANFPTHNSENGYHEPFFGGGALFFRTAPHGANSSINDVNRRLMNFYKVVRDSPKELLRELESFREPEDSPDATLDYASENYRGEPITDYYYQQRELFNRRVRGLDFDEVHEAALFMYLNRTCYNGLYRENQSGEFNVPIGGNPNADWVKSSSVKAASEALRLVDIRSGDFEYILDVAQGGDTVYFDPPYKPGSASSNFVDYTREGFGEQEQKRLRDVASELAERGVHVVISNSPPVENLYDSLDGFSIKTVRAKRQINSDGTNRGAVKEIVITNVPDEERRENLSALDSFVAGE